MYNTKNPKRAVDYLIQGDVCGKRLGKLPEGLKPVNSSVIALGEATGHHHVLTGAQLFTDEFGNLFAKVDKPVMLLHQEHAPWIVQGIWQFGERGIFQVEYDGEEERRAMD